MRLAILLVFIPSLAMGQGLTKLGPGQRPTTNYVKQSSPSLAAAVVTPWALTGPPAIATSAGAPYGTWMSVTGTTGYEYVYQPSVVVPSSTSFVLSFWAKKASGSGYMGAAINVGASVPSTCLCIRPSGGTCTATPSAGGCNIEIPNLTTVVERVGVVAVYPAAAAATVILFPQRHSVTAETTLFAGVQLETSRSRPGFFCPTTTAAKTCR